MAFFCTDLFCSQLYPPNRVKQKLPPIPEDMKPVVGVSIILRREDQVCLFGLLLGFPLSCAGRTRYVCLVCYWGLHYPAQGGPGMSVWFVIWVSIILRREDQVCLFGLLLGFPLSCAGRTRYVCLVCYWGLHYPVQGGPGMSVWFVIGVSIILCREDQVCLFGLLLGFPLSCAGRTRYVCLVCYWGLHYPTQGGPGMSVWFVDHSC